MLDGIYIHDYQVINHLVHQPVAVAQETHPATLLKAVAMTATEMAISTLYVLLSTVLFILPLTVLIIFGFTNCPRKAKPCSSTSRSTPTQVLPHSGHPSTTAALIEFRKSVAPSMRSRQCHTAAGAGTRLSESGRSPLHSGPRYTRPSSISVTASNSTGRHRNDVSVPRATVQ